MVGFWAAKARPRNDSLVADERPQHRSLIAPQGYIARVLHHGAYQRRHNAQPQLPTSNTGFHRREGTCRHCRLQKRGRRPEATTIDSATVGIELREEHVGARTCWTTKSHNARRQLTPCMSSWVSTRVSNRRSGDTGGQL